MLTKKIQLLTLGSALFLTACQTTQNTQSNATNERIDAALERAAEQASENGKGASSYLEKKYKKDSSNPVKATKYAQSLRESGDIEKAALILEAHANSTVASVETLREFASINLELGQYETAQKFAKKAIETDPKDGQGFHVLGIAQDALGEHEDAEISFRKALDLWSGDPVPIMNNLALNLASQGRVDDAVDILKKAKELAPNRREVERNLRIISTLNEKV